MKNPPTCRFLEKMNAQKWEHGGYYVVFHKMHGELFVQILRTRPAEGGRAAQLTVLTHYIFQITQT